MHSMMTRLLTATVLAAGLAFAACTTSTPAAPSPPAATSTLPGQTLKATAPEPQSPKDDIRLEGLRATFVVSNARAEFTDGEFDYRFEVVDPADRVVYTSLKVAGQPGSTRHDLPMDLELDTRYRWRARAERDIYHGPWSSFVSFRTIDYRGIVPRPPGGRWPSDPEEVVAYIADSFPEYLEPTHTLNERLENMEFLRDRIIEAGICGGLDVGRNLKRGIGPHSHDAIAWRHSPSNVDVIDIASGFDDNANHLHLHWVEVDGPPGFDGYPNHPGC
jgi:hypothetical protein